MDPMTAAALSATGKAVEKSLSDDPVVDGVLVERALASGELDVAARARARREGVKQVVRLRIVQPIGRALGMPKSYFQFDFEDELAVRMVGVSDEDIVPPRLSIASPALDGVRITVDEPELRNLYLNLLASASDSATSDAVHPSFISVIASITALEADVLRTVLLDDCAIVEVLAVQGDGHLTVGTNLISAACQGGGDIDPRFSLYVTNWVRLGLCEIQWDRHIADPGFYEWTEAESFRQHFRGLVDAAFDGGAAMTVNKGTLRVTDFGTEFRRVVIDDRQSRTAAS